MADRFAEHDLRCFGPLAAAAALEGSKAFTKDFLQRHGVPTARYETFTDLAAAIDYIRANAAPIVIKADGLAAGKGVVVAATEDDAIAAATDMLSQRAFGDAGSRIVIEEYLDGEEASFIVVTDGRNILPLASSQDHKARDDGDSGPNTGGMGAYSPAPVVTPVIERRILAEVVQPTLRGLALDRIRYLGFLYAGLMIAADGTPRVIEFNCRLGDPETQPIMMRLESDLVEICLAAIDGRLAAQNARWDSRAALGVVMAAGGYPGHYETGMEIHGLPPVDSDDCKVFHAGTRGGGDAGLRQIRVSGGRVLCVVGLGTSVEQAADTAYRQVREIEWDGAYYRSDIGHRAIARERA
jgi:phosphoribosylamine--glycine ligase